jgi:hypothetical protein
VSSAPKSSQPCPPDQTPPWWPVAALAMGGPPGPPLCVADPGSNGAAGGPRSRAVSSRTRLRT